MLQRRTTWKALHALSYTLQAAHGAAEAPLAVWAVADAGASTATCLLHHAWVLPIFRTSGSHILWSANQTRTFGSIATGSQLQSQDVAKDRVPVVHTRVHDLDAHKLITLAFDAAEDIHELSKVIKEEQRHLDPPLIRAALERLQAISLRDTVEGFKHGARTFKLLMKLLTPYMQECDMSILSCCLSTCWAHRFPTQAMEPVLDTLMTANQALFKFGATQDLLSSARVLSLLGGVPNRQLLFNKVIRPLWGRLDAISTDELCNLLHACERLRYQKDKFWILATDEVLLRIKTTYNQVTATSMANTHTHLPTPSSSPHPATHTDDTAPSHPPLSPELSHEAASRQLLTPLDLASILRRLASLRRVDMSVVGASAALGLRQLYALGPETGLTSDVVGHLSAALVSAASVSKAAEAKAGAHLPLHLQFLQAASQHLLAPTTQPFDHLASPTTPTTSTTTSRPPRKYTPKPQHAAKKRNDAVPVTDISSIMAAIEAGGDLSQLLQPQQEAPQPLQLDPGIRPPSRTELLPPELRTDPPGNPYHAPTPLHPHHSSSLTNSHSMRRSTAHTSTSSPDAAPPRTPSTLLTTMSSTALSNLLWAHGESGQHNYELFEEAAYDIVSRVGDFGGPDLADMAWTYGKFAHRRLDLFEAISKQVRQLGADSLPPGSWANLFLGFGAANVRDMELINAVSDAIFLDSHALSAADIAGVLWGCTALGCVSAELFHRLLRELHELLGKDEVDVTTQLRLAEVHIELIEQRMELAGQQLGLSGDLYKLCMSTWRENLPHASSSTTAFEDSVFQTLARVSLQPMLFSHLANGLLACDMHVQVGDHVCVIECLEPEDFTTTHPLVLRGEAALRARQLERRVPNVVFLPYFVWDKILGSGDHARTCVHALGLEELLEHEGALSAAK